MNTAFKLIIALTFVLSSFLVNGQGLVVRAGVNLSNLVAESDGTSLSDDFESLLGYNLGLNAEFPINNLLSFEPGVCLNTKGYKVEQSSTGVESKTKVMMNYLDVPLNLRANFEIGDGAISVAAGPFVGMALSGQAESETTILGVTEEESEDIKFGNDDSDDFKSLDFGANFEAGFSINRVTTNVFYTLGLANIANGDNITAMNNIMGVKLGFRIIEN